MELGEGGWFNGSGYCLSYSIDMICGFFGSSSHLSSRRSLFWGAERATDVNAPENVLVHKTTKPTKNHDEKHHSAFDAVISYSR